MLEKYGKIFDIAYELAKTRHEVLSEKPAKKGTEPNTAYDAAGRALKDFLSCLDIDTLKILQVVMYIGRDLDSHTVLKPDRILSDYRKRYCATWQTKEIEMLPLTESFMLDNYIKSGLQILQIW